MKRTAMLMAVLLGAVFVCTEKATADQFVFKQCSGAESVGLSGFYSQLGDDYVDVIAGCNGGSSGKLGVYQDRFPFCYHEYQRQNGITPIQQCQGG